MSIEGKDITGLFKRYPIPAVCLTVFFAGLAVFYFRFGVLNEMTVKLEEKTTELKRYNLNIEAAKQLDEQLASLVKANQQFQGSAIRVTELAKNPEIFYTLEKETGATLIDVKQLVTTAPSKAAPDSYMIIPFTVTADGDFKQLISLLKRLEFGQQVGRISSASLSPSQSGRLALNLTIDCLGTR
jgi:hypothetical protein